VSDRISFIPLAYNDRPVMTPPSVAATDQLILETRLALEETGGDAVQMADWIAQRIEEFGAMQAEPMFDMEGNGPICSWCAAFWPLCGHSKRSEVLGEGDA
jgi:hypothetical protein